MSVIPWRDQENFAQTAAIILGKVVKLICLHTQIQKFIVDSKIRCVKADTLESSICG